MCFWTMILIMNDDDDDEEEEEDHLLNADVSRVYHQKLSII